MKKIICVVLLFIKITGFAQSNYVDSLKLQLSKTTNPLDSFSIIVKISEFNFVLGGGEANETTTLQLLSLAQKLKNDSLLAISYNWIGSYFIFTKGDNTAALDYYFKALPLAVKVRDKRRISSLYFDISLVFLRFRTRKKL